MKREDLTQEYLKECLDYNKDTGIFTWKHRPLSHFNTLRSCNASNTKCAGKKAGAQHKNQYVRIEINSIPYRAHRLAWFYEYGIWPVEDIDHIDTVKYHNWITNLREATNAENGQNRVKAKIDNKSTGLLGVRPVMGSKTFYAQITINKKKLHLGCFKTPELAHEAYVKAKREIHPFGTL